MEGTVNQRVEILLREKEISQTEIAKKLSVSKQTVSNWISGNVQIPLRHIVSLLTEYDWINARWLLVGKGSMEDLQGKKQKDSPDQLKCEGMVDLLTRQLKDKDDLILSLQKEVGKLEERLENRKH
ncbi:MAG: hypothetical protein FD166_1424 [Bacteroidetes bacterium]|nr:MAG: hypothetical protein FD166_1424 [Bacteroidota bacterium]